MMLNRKILLRGSCLCCVALNAPAFAQIKDSVSQQPATEQQADTSARFEEIIVTAQRRAQRLQDVPIAISAVSAAGLENAGVTGTADLQIAVPSLNITRNGSGALPFLRGVGSSLGDPNAEPSVAVYVDGVYRPSYIANYLEFNDIERVEVLKGPQGTLFGRNATGGVIHVITKAPSDTLTGNFTAGYGNYDTVSLNGYLSGPIAEDVRFSTSVYYEKRQDGWGRNLFTGQENIGSRNYSGRLKLEITPGDATKITLAGSYGETSDGGLEAQPVDLKGSTFALAYPGKYNTINNFPNYSEVKALNASLNVEQDLGAVSLRSITAYERVRGDWFLDFDISPASIVHADIDQNSDMFSQEVHLLSSAGSKFQWLLGGYYYHRRAAYEPEELPSPGIDFNSHSIVDSVSAFGQVTVPLAESTSFTGGFRYSWETIKGEGAITLHGTDIIIDTPDGRPARNKFSYSKPTWRLALDHKFTPNIMAYASYNRGMKSGNFGISAGAAGIAEPYLPERLDAYEIGMKTDLFDRTIRFNAAAFYYSFRNIQFQKYVGGAALIVNGPSATIYGGEAELEVIASQNLTLNANIGLLHSEFGDFPAGPDKPVNTCLTPQGTTDTGGFFCDPVTGFATNIPFNGKGKPLVLAPDLTANIGFTYRIPSSIGEFTLASNLYYADSTSAELGNRIRVQSRTLLNASIAWRDPTERFTARIWGRNLTDAYYYAQVAAAPGLNDLGGAAPPRTYGVTIAYKF